MAKKKSRAGESAQYAAIPNQVFLGLPWKTVRPKYERITQKLRKKYPLSFVIVGRELMILGLRGAVTAADGTVLRPSIWGKLKANVQFAAILLAIWRPDVSVGSVRLDQLAMLVAAVVTVGSAGEYLARFGGALARRERRA